MRSRLLRREASPVPGDAPSGPIRTCIGCRRRGAADTMVRIVPCDVAPGFVIGRSLPGRGAWLCEADAGVLPSESCIAEALRRKALARAFRVRATGRN